jgi:hypothetical protein
MPLKTDGYAMFENRDLKPREFLFFFNFLKPFLGLFFFNIYKRTKSDTSSETLTQQVCKITKTHPTLVFPPKYGVPVHVPVPLQGLKQNQEIFFRSSSLITVNSNSGPGSEIQARFGSSSY